MATVAATGGSRQARRRRIVDRGTDRLALITGRIQSLPADHRETDVAQHEHVASNPDHDSAQPHVSDETKELFSTPGVEEEQSQILEEKSQITSPSLQIPSHSRQIEHSHRKLFTTGQISSAISGSENARMCSSVAAAILVVMGFCNIGTVVISKPFYLLVLTNVSIVLARIVLGTKTRMTHTRSAPKLGGNALVDHIGTTLESGLMLQKIFGAVFMDFNIYVIVLVCGLSLASFLGW